MGYLVPIIMLLGLGIMAFFMTRTKKQQALWLKETALSHGWSCKTGSEGASGVYQISGANAQGIKWELNTYSRTSTKDRSFVLQPSREYTEWISKISVNKGELLVMPRDPSWKNFSDDQILGFIKPAWKAMGLPADQFVAYTEVKKDLNTMYMLYTTNPEFGKIILQDDLISLLIKWQDVTSVKGSLVNIRISPTECALQVGYILNKPEEAELIISIGEKILDCIDKIH